MAHVDKAIMAEAKVENSRELESTSGTGESSDFFTAQEVARRTSSKDASGGACDGATSSSEYKSKRIQEMMESRSKYATALEAEIEASKAHWSQLPPADDVELGSAQGDWEVFRRLQQLCPNFFRDRKEGRWELEEKIAEGGQAEIFAVKFLHPGSAYLNGTTVAKVMKQEAGSLEDLQKQWPPGMLQKISTSGQGSYSAINGGEMMKDGRFVFFLGRCWGDLRKLIDLRMQHNGNQAPPFKDETVIRIMYSIAMGMRGLHNDNIIHRDLKASNVLIWPEIWGHMDASRDDFDPLNDEKFLVLLQILRALLELWAQDFGEHLRS